MMRVLIAEDDASSRLMLSEALTAFGYQTMEAADGEEALKILASNSPPEVVLLDVQMPRLDGFGVVRAIRQTPAWEHLPVLALTAAAMTGDKEKCLAAGFDDYVTKPLDLAVLRAKIQAVARNGEER